MNVGESGGETSDQRLRVFISSSPGELAEEREAASAAVRTLRLTSLLRGPGAGSHPLGESDVFVGIYWQSYGWTASPSTLSGIEAEAARYEGRHMSPRDALTQLARASALYEAPHV